MYRLITAILFAATLVLAQTPDAKPSLGETAKKIREEKDKAATPKATRVFTNEAIKPAAPEIATANKEKPAEDDPFLPKSKTDKPANLEKQYRDRFANLRVALKTAENQAKDLKDEMAKFALSTVTVEHYYYDEKRVKALQGEIDRNNLGITGFKKQVADLEEDLRTKGLPSRWADAATP